jgi:hypothetical protein
MGIDIIELLDPLAGGLSADDGLPKSSFVGDTDKNKSCGENRLLSQNH